MWVRDGKTAITTKTLLEEKSFCKQSSLLYICIISLSKLKKLLQNIII